MRIFYKYFSATLKKALVPFYFAEKVDTKKVDTTCCVCFFIMI